MMDTATASESVNDLRPTSAVELLSRLVAPRVVSEEDTAALANVRPLLRTRNAVMTAILRSARRAARVPATVLLIGESGTGKQLLARQIHEWSPSRDRRFFPVDCTGISEALMAAETVEAQTALLTGTGAGDCTNGHGGPPGTIFLENVAELDLEAQAKLLNFADAERLTAVSGRNGKSWTRIIAASNRDLVSAVGARKFRADLFYRINVVSLRIPALRERPEDILPLAESVLREEAIRYGRRDLQFSAGARFALQHRPWLGNALELSSVVESAVILSANDLISADDIPELSDRYAPAATAAAEPAAKLGEVERNHIARVLASGVTAAKAAEILGVSASTLARKRKRYNLL